ncbi:hypothetical protein evm_001882 [Chilo suppressalis]|nr:hypothetical protein evm_001882 [Chilo suppressalis]
MAKSLVHEGDGRCQLVPIMEQIVVKTEVQPNGEILLFYVDENAVDSNGDQVLHLEEGTDYEILQANDDENYNNSDTLLSDQWTEEELQKLIIFYYDNNEAFFSGATQQQHLWAIACKTMLTGRTAQDCMNRLEILKKMYAQQRIDHEKGYNINWSLYDLCNQAFYDDTYVNSLLKGNEQENKTLTKVPIPMIPTHTTTMDDSKGGIIVVKSVNTTSKNVPDDKVETMLKLYLRYKKQKDIPTKAIWETIALELGEESSEYWHKRFLNFKQHYLRMLSKRSVDGPTTINWPYMALFDEIFKDDPVFQSKHAIETTGTTNTFEVPIINIDEWNNTECTVLAKYYFDCFNEFQDASIPNKFLWTEVGRLLDKKPDDCKNKYEELKAAHYDKYFPGGYTLRGRIPMEIIYDNIISKEVEIELVSNRNSTPNVWNTEEIDELVKYFYQNVELFKDEVCYFVCWACISRALNKSIHSCRKQWEELKMLYKSILSDKMENSDMQIDWRYIELFDRIFDYGMDTNLLNDDKIKDLQSKSDSKIGVKMVNINYGNEPYENGTDDEEFDERGFTKRTKRGFGDSKAFKILEYYQKNKDRFSTTQRKKQELWEVIAKQIGITAEQCAHRFRNLKQVYTSYVQREINKPDMPIIWPYYALCKKVFGYRAIKTKLKNNKMDSDEVDEWTPKEIKQVINYFKEHFNEISNSNDVTKWRGLARELQKTESNIRDKFHELKKSYKSLKTVKEHNPAYKVSWKYFNLFDEIYQKSDGNDMEVEALDEDNNEDDDDYQCIIVIPEDGDINDLSNAQVIIKPNSNDKEQQDEVPELVEEETKPAPIKWTKKSKRRLLILYHNYIKTRKGQEINRKEMWNEISSKMTSKTPLSCRKMFAKLKANHSKAKDLDDESKNKSPYYTLMEKIMKLKPKFHKVSQENLSEDKLYKDVLLPANKVELALQYYLQHIEEFASPKFEKKYLWTELANFVSEPVNKLYNKINYLKQNYNVETDEVAGEKTLFSELLREILTKENAVKAQITVPVAPDDNEEVSWSDDEIEQLLIWYLANLDKFKNPKFVRKYLWLEAYSILGKSPLICSKKMTEIRTQYKTMIKESPEDLNHWRFYELCQKIYGTGKKSETINVTQVTEENSM